MPSPSLSPPPFDLDLPAGEIHIWYAVLDQPVSHFCRFIQTLSMDERMRAERFYFEKDRKRFITRRGILRMILGRYLSIEPNRLQFSYGKSGKPALTDTFGKGTILFNVSDSGRLALYGFTRDREIGVDIEQVHDISDMDQIAERFFSVRENAIFHALPERNKKEAFFKCWTRKEAFIKAVGDGLSRPLDTFDVSLGPDEPARLLRIEGDSNDPPRWSIQELELAPGYASAFGIEGRRWRLHCWKWSNQHA